jgi:hypothetical protein
MINIDTRLLPQVTPDQLFLLCHIVNFMNENKMCFPSNKKLIEQCKFSDSKILRIKNELVTRKIISVKQRFRPDGSQTSNLYKIETEFIGVFVTGKSMSNLDTTPFTNEEGDTFTHEGGTPLTMKPHEVLTNRSINHIKVLSSSSSENSKEFSPIEINGIEIKEKKNGKVNPFQLISELQKEEEREKTSDKKEKEERKPNPTYEAFTVFCQTFERLSGANYPKDKNGNYLMSKKDAGGMVYLMRNVEQVDRNGNSIEALKVFVTAAWNLNDKWIRANFTPNTLYGQFSKIFTGYQTSSPEMIEKKKNDRIAELLAEKMKQYDNQ